MQFFDDLRREHALIERVLGSLRTWADRFARGEARAADGLAFVRFFEIYAGAFHHEREEEVLFPALTGEASLPADRGPVATLLGDHRTMGTLLAGIRVAVERSPADAAVARDPAVAYSHALWHHIDAENSVLFPESEARLRRAGVHMLPSRPPTEEEEAVAESGRALIEAYPPMEPDVIRGEGCALCPAYGDGCEGIEREWWNEWEWEEMDDHIASS